MNPLNPKTTLTISTAVVLVVALLAWAAIAVWAPDDSREQLLTSAGVLGFVICALARSLWSKPDVDDRDDKGSSSGTGAALLVVLAIGATAPALIGCSPSTWDAHAFTAMALRDSANAGNQLIRDARATDLRAAGERARSSGGDIGAAIDAAAAQWDHDHVDAIDGQRALAESSTAYSNGAYAAIRGEATDPDELSSVGRHAVAAYNALAAILRRYGLSGLPTLPEGTGEFLGALVGELATNAEGGR